MHYYGTWSKHLTHSGIKSLARNLELVNHICKEHGTTLAVLLPMIAHSKLLNNIIQTHMYVYT